MEFAKQIYPELGPYRNYDYVGKVLDGVVSCIRVYIGTLIDITMLSKLIYCNLGIEFIENQLFSLNVNGFPQLVIHHLKPDNPIISPIMIEWQKEKCDLLGFQFQQQTDQHSSLRGKCWEILNLGGRFYYW